MITYLKNQKDLAETIKHVIDSYWNNEQSEIDMEKQIITLVDRNREKVFEEQEYKSVIRQRLGKRRLLLMNKILGIKPN